MKSKEKCRERYQCFFCKGFLNDNRTYPRSQLTKVLIDWNFESEIGTTSRGTKDHTLFPEFYCVNHYRNGKPLAPNNLGQFSRAGVTCIACDVYTAKDGKRKQKEYSGPPYVRLLLPTPSSGTELVWATPIGEGRYVIKDIPFFSEAACFLDTVQAEDHGLDSIELHFVRVVERKGNGTVHLRVSKPSTIQNLKRLKGQKRMRLTIVGQADDLYSLSVPSRNWKTVNAFLDRYSKKGTLKVEKKVSPSLSL